MKHYLLSSTLVLCTSLVSLQAQTLPKLSTFGLAPITSITDPGEEDDDESYRVEIAYEDGRICSFKGEAEGCMTTLQLNPLQLIVSSSNEDNAIIAIIKDFVLDEVGCATAWKTIVGENIYECSATYNEKHQLQTLQLEEGRVSTLTWTDDNLTSIQTSYGNSSDSKTRIITYSDKPSNGFTVVAEVPDYDYCGFFFTSGLFGAQSKNLPSGIVNTWISMSGSNKDTVDLEYEYDSQNRVTTVIGTYNGNFSFPEYFTYGETTSLTNKTSQVFTPTTRKTNRGIICTMPDGSLKTYDYLGR